MLGSSCIFVPKSVKRTTEKPCEISAVRSTDLAFSPEGTQPRGVGAGLLSVVGFADFLPVAQRVHHFIPCGIETI